MDRGAWHAIDNGVEKSQTQLNTHALGLIYLFLGGRGSLA